MLPRGRRGKKREKKEEEEIILLHTKVKMIHPEASMNVSSKFRSDPFDIFLRPFTLTANFNF